VCAAMAEVDSPQGPWVPWRVYTRDMDEVLKRLDRVACALEKSALVRAHDAGTDEAEAERGGRRRTVWLLVAAAAFALVGNVVLNVVALIIASRG